MTTAHPARAALQQAQRVVVKVGSGLLAGWGTHVDRGVADQVVVQVAALVATGREVVIVSSGAVALGCERLGLEERPSDIPTVQAAAAIGQGDLVALYSTALRAHGLLPAQVLVTHADLADRRRFLNARHALVRLLDLDCVPIVNENDTVAVDELKVGDNDNLAAHVANLIEADLLVILTDQDGLHDIDPRVDRNAARIPLVETGETLPEKAAGGAGGELSVGGMATKIEAGRRAAAFGVPAVVADGHQPDALAAILAGDDRGTLFYAASRRRRSRKAWISGLNSTGRLVLDSGASRALAKRGISLLPSGIARVEGVFENGDPVTLTDEHGNELARGLSAYSSAEIERIRGKQTSEIKGVLGYHLGDAVVHRDDLSLSQA